MSFDIIEKLKNEIAGFRDDSKWEEVGEVIEVGDGICKILGLKNAASQEILEIETSQGKRRALSLNLEEDSIGALVIDDYHSVKVGDKVKTTGEIISIQVGEELLGRVIDPLGNPLDGLGDIFSKNSKPEKYFLENKAPSVLERESVNTPLHTGIKAIDAMIPIGRGQRELIIGDRQTGKTAIALDAIINQQFDASTRKPVKCIYVAIGQKESKIAKIIQTLKEHNALSYTIVVSASSSSPAALIYLAPFSGCAIGEYFRDKGEDVLIVYDDLSKHAVAYREISLLLRRPPGREAYPGDVFYLHSRLLERAAKLSKEKGGGSLTALPIIETQLGDVTAYIPTNVISITDGQIYLESDLFYQGIRPAVNVGLSVSRVGGAAQTKAIKKIVGGLRYNLAQFRELQAFVQFASDVDEVTRQKIERGQKIVEILKQDDLSPISFEKQAIVFYAALNNFFEKIPTNKIKETELKLLDYIINFHSDILEEIKKLNELSPENEEKLKSALNHFFAENNFK
ncbi:MAG: F0F1 ATP synthase subunit alpha [Minisyncoccia bacterium]